MTVLRIPAALAFTLVAGSAMAHTGHGGSFPSGLAHPFSGLDHLLAMFAVGLYAARQAGAARWLLPAGFVAAMLGGAALGAAGLALPLVEAGIAASVLVFGLLIAFIVRLPIAAALPLVTAFALIHGHAHHAEMGGGSPMTYAAGFAIATGVLHAAGYALARWTPEAGWAKRFDRLMGGLIAGTGAVLLGS
jgi:urease accessory protein